MTYQVATSLCISRGSVPSRLAVGPIRKSYHGRIKIDEMQLFACMAVVTGVTGGPPIFIHMFLVFFKITGLNFSGNVGLVTMADETNFLIRYPG